MRMRKELKGLRDFLLRGNVVELAVAVLIGSAFGQVVNSLVSDVFTPLFGALGGAPDFSSLHLGPVAIGRFLNAVVSFLITGSAIYLLVVLPMRKGQERGNTPAPEPPEEVRLLRAILEELRNRQ
nr:MAG: large-conductance mechanosensitive channel [Bacteroidota bacterium]